MGYESVGWIGLAQVRNMFMSIKYGTFVIVGTVCDWTFAEVSHLKIDYIFRAEDFRMRLKSADTTWWAGIV
jgi:hypothetical protein